MNVSITDTTRSTAASTEFCHSRSSGSDVGGPGVRGGGELSKVDQRGGRDLTTGNDGQEVGSGSASPVQSDGLTLNDGSL